MYRRAWRGNGGFPNEESGICKELAFHAQGHKARAAFGEARRERAQSKR